MTKEGKRWPIAVLQDTGILEMNYKVPDKYFILGTLNISGSIDVARLNEAICGTIEHNDVLKLEVVINDEEKDLVYTEREGYTLDYYDYAADCCDGSINEEKMKDVLKKTIIEGPPSGLSFGFLLFRTEEFEYSLVMEINHIIFDGTSTNLIFNEIAARYNGEPVQEHEADFTDFLDELSNEEHLEKRRKMIAFCNEMQEGYRDFVDWTVKDDEPEVNKPIAFLDTEDLTELSKKLHSSSFMINLFIYHVALSLAYREKDTLTFYPLAEREHRFRYTAGLIVEQILSRLKLEDDELLVDSFKRFGKTFYKNMKMARRGKTVDELPSFCLTSLNFAQSEEIRFGDAEAETDMEYTFSITPKTDINMVIGILMQNEETTMFALLYNESVIPSETIRRMTWSYTKVLDALMNEDQVTVGDLRKELESCVLEDSI